MRLSRQLLCSWLPAPPPPGKTSVPTQPPFWGASKPPNPPRPQPWHGGGRLHQGGLRYYTDFYLYLVELGHYTATYLDLGIGYHIVSYVYLGGIGYYIDSYVYFVGLGYYIDSYVYIGHWVLHRLLRVHRTLGTTSSPTWALELGTTS